MSPALTFLRTLWAVDHGLARISRHMERELGVTGPQRLTIRLISLTPGIGPAELAEMLHVHRSAATGIIRRLEAKNLVSRTVDERDARRRRLSLTPSGQAINGVDRGTIESRVRRVLAGSRPAEIGTVVRLLERLATALKVDG